MKPLLFEENSHEEYINWATENRKIWERINDLIKDIDRNYFKGIGKPEPLKHQRKGYCGAARAVKKNYR